MKIFDNDRFMWVILSVTFLMFFAQLIRAFIKFVWL